MWLHGPLSLPLALTPSLPLSAKTIKADARAPPRWFATNTADPYFAHFPSLSIIYHLSRTAIPRPNHLYPSTGNTSPPHSLATSGRFHQFAPPHDSSQHSQHRPPTTSFDDPPKRPRRALFSIPSPAQRDRTQEGLPGYPGHTRVIASTPGQSETRSDAPAADPTPWRAPTRSVLPLPSSPSLNLCFHFCVQWQS